MELESLPIIKLKPLDKIKAIEYNVDIDKKIIDKQD